MVVRYLNAVATRSSSGSACCLYVGEAYCSLTKTIRSRSNSDWVATTFVVRLLNQGYSMEYNNVASDAL